MTDPVQDISRAFEAGHPALLVTGRSLYDFVGVEGKLRPLCEAIARSFRATYGMQLIRYSLAAGLDWDASRVDDERDRRTIEQALRANRLLDIPQDQNEVVRVIRGIASLSRSPGGALRWADGREMRFAFLFEFSEHLAPGTLTNGTQADAQLVAIELAHIVAQSLALRYSGNLVIFHGREGLIDHLVGCALHHVRLAQPDREEKAAFLGLATALYDSASFENGLRADEVAHLTTNTPNRSLEILLRESQRTGQSLSRKQLTAQKSRDVQELSEQSLTVLDTDRVKDLHLSGRNVQTAVGVLNILAEALRRGDPAMQANVVLSGSPGNGKTDLALLVARAAGVPAYQMHTPKRSHVGETERVAELQPSLLKQWQPNIAFVDEITESLPMERSEFNGDSGASQAVLGALLSALSDESRRGRSLLIATTNCPWRIGAAMRSRFTVIPVLHPLKEDYPAIVTETAKRVAAIADVSSSNPLVEEAARLFYLKGASPRLIRAALSNALLLKGQISPETILFAAEDLCASSDLLSALYADLWAIRSCSSRSFFPWSEDPSDYPFPEHLVGIVDPLTGNLNETELTKRINELKPHANV